MDSIESSSCILDVALPRYGKYTYNKTVVKFASFLQLRGKVHLEADKVGWI